MAHSNNYKDIRKRIEEFECKDTYFRVEGIYPLKVVMRLQNEMMEHLLGTEFKKLIIAFKA